MEYTQASLETTIAGYFQRDADGNAVVNEKGEATRFKDYSMAVVTCPVCRAIFGGVEDTPTQDVDAFVGGLRKAVASELAEHLLSAHASP